MEDALKQWIDVHGVSVRPRIEHDVEGHSRRVWRTEADEDVIEAITIKGMPHGVPLATGGGPERCGNAGPFHFDVGLSSSHHRSFLGLTARPAALEPRAVPQAPLHLAPIVVQSAGTALIAAREHASADAKFTPRDDASENYASARRGAAHDPRGIIAAALRAAGLLRTGEPAGDRGNNNPLDPNGVIKTTLRSVGLLKE
jgi:hypothetical protein